MQLSRKDKTSQILALSLICLFPCAAYFCYDAPASLQKYLMAGLEINGNDYMSFYTWYSAPNIVMAVVGGILVDKYLGHRFGSVCFCFLVFLGQLIFAYSISSGFVTLAKVGRALKGTGVESIAVASNIYLSVWFKGTSLQSLAFGTALAVWRISSTLNLVLMVPFYKNTNTLKPVDGSTNNFAMCLGCSNWDQDMVSADPKYTVNGDIQFASWMEEKEYNIDQGYYCYSRKMVDSCQIDSMNKVAQWNKGQSADNNKMDACQLSGKTTQFINDARIFTSGCLDINSDTNEWTWDMPRCECINSKFQPLNQTWISEQYNSIEDDEQKKELEIIIGDKPLESLLRPGYWSESFGEYLEKDDVEKRENLIKELHTIQCKKQYEIDITFSDRYNKEANNIQESNLLNDYWLSVGEFVSAMQDPGLYTTETDTKFNCNKTVSYLTSIPVDDTNERLDSVGSVYYFMLVVAAISCIVGVFLMMFDAKAEKNDIDSGVSKSKKESEDQEQETFGTIIKEQVQVISELPQDTWLLYLFCILFYVCVFVFISQAPKFFQEHVGVSEELAGVSCGLVYSVAVPFNFLIGYLISQLDNQLVFMTAGITLAGVAHLWMLFVKGFFGSVGGPVLLALSYSCVGTTLWPFAALIVPEKISGRMYGVMYSTQQLGLTAGSKIAGYLFTNFSWFYLEAFFVILSGCGIFIMFILLGKYGRNFPKSYDEIHGTADVDEIEAKGQEAKEGEDAEGQRFLESPQ